MHKIKKLKKKIAAKAQQRAVEPKIDIPARRHNKKLRAGGKG
jgi:mRNA-degrading endonuclease RelE of RelBE toxin-antitoxin system